MGKIFSEKYDNTVDYSLLPESDRVFAAAEFKDTLKKTWDTRSRTSTYNGELDIDAFHRAYDKDLKDLGLYDTLFNTHGKLKASSLYGIIKGIIDPKYAKLAKALTDFWVAQFKERLPVRENGPFIPFIPTVPSGITAIKARPEYSRDFGDSKLVFFVYYFAELSRFFTVVKTNDTLSWLKDSGDSFDFSTAELVCIKEVKSMKNGVFTVSNTSLNYYNSKFETNLGLTQSKVHDSLPPTPPDTRENYFISSPIESTYKDLGLDLATEIQRYKF